MHQYLCSFLPGHYWNACKTIPKEWLDWHRTVGRKTIVCGSNERELVEKLNTKLPYLNSDQTQNLLHSAWNNYESKPSKLYFAGPTLIRSNSYREFHIEANPNEPGRVSIQDSNNVVCPKSAFVNNENHIKCSTTRFPRRDTPTELYVGESMEYSKKYWEEFLKVLPSMSYVQYYVRGAYRDHIYNIHGGFNMDYPIDIKCNIYVGFNMDYPIDFDTKDNFDNDRIALITCDRNLYDEMSSGCSLYGDAIDLYDESYLALNKNEILGPYMEYYLKGIQIPHKIFWYMKYSEKFTQKKIFPDTNHFYRDNEF